MRMYGLDLSERYAKEIQTKAPHSVFLSIKGFREKIMARRILIAGNWKMNGLKADGLSLASEVASRMKTELIAEIRHARLSGRHPYRAGRRDHYG